MPKINYTFNDSLEEVEVIYGYTISMRKVIWQGNSTYLDGIDVFTYFGFA